MSNSRERETHKRKRRKRYRLTNTAPVFLLLVVVIIAAFLLRAHAINSLSEFTKAESGVLEEMIEARAVLMRQESLLTAPAAGVFSPSVQEGAKVAANSLLGYISGTAVRAPRAGIVSFISDGFEHILFPDNPDEIDIKKVFERAAQGPPQGKSGERLERGEVFGRVVDNLANYFWLILYYPGRNDIEAADNTLKLRLADGRELSGSVIRQGSLEDGQFFIVRVNGLMMSAELQRVLSVYSVGKKYSAGVIIPQSALLEKEEQGWGVYVREKNILVFKPVEVLGVIGGQASVSGVDPGADVLVNSRYAREGHKVK